MNVCIYGAASDCIDRVYTDRAFELGAALGRRGGGLIFGGGGRGMMGAAARGVRSAGGRVVGVAPRFFDREGVLFPDCTDFVFTETMRERKQAMEDRSDAFVMTPGGIGTYEEFFEILTLRQLGRHAKPIAVYNIRGYFDPLEAMLRESAARGFLPAENLSLYRTFTEAEPLLDWVFGAGGASGAR